MREKRRSAPRSGWRFGRKRCASRASARRRPTIAWGPGERHRLSRRRVDLSRAAAHRRDDEGHGRQPDPHGRAADRLERPGVPLLAARGRHGAQPMTTAKPTPSRRGAQRLVILIPYLWLLAFFLVPFLIVLKISLSQSAIAQPPYTPVLDPAAGWAALKDFFAELSFANYLSLAADTLYLSSYLKSVQVAAFSTMILLVIGYALAYGMAHAPRRLQPLLVTLVVLPFWTSFLIRVYAWINILQRDGLLNQALLALRLVDEPPVWLATDTAIYIGIVYSYLPFMVLPIYAALEKLDESLLEAAADLGCPPWKTFWLVTLPLSL